MVSAIGPHYQHTDYRPNPLSRKTDEWLQPFPISVVRVDYEHHSLSVRSSLDGNVFDDVTVFPVGSSGAENNDIDMPEIGWSGMGSFYNVRRGSMQMCVLAWTPSGMPFNFEAAATRPFVDMPGRSTRKRGVHRKAYPGQRSRTTSMGLHEHDGSGWERMASDMSQDRLDPNRREWIQMTGRAVTHTEAGLRYNGPVVRPGADVTLVPPEVLPDGKTQQVVYLADSKSRSSRYSSGVADMLPVSEVLDRIQEFGLDFPLPHEVLSSPLLDEVLGTRADVWGRTKVVKQGITSRDDQSFLADQGIDHPHAGDRTAVGPTSREGSTPRRRGFILEKAQGTLVGYNVWDKATYGKVLKPTIWPLTKTGRFGTDTTTGHEAVVPSPDHVESRLAATAFMVRFPYEYNSTRMEITKEGQVYFEIGCTIPRENIGLDAGSYEHPHGAGRSLEAHLLGSAKIVVGKNRDEEESLDITTLGQVVLRLGADDGSLPQSGRSVLAQDRGKADSILARTLQFWNKAKLVSDKDAGDLENKTGAENVSLRAALDGGTFLRLGARSSKSKRRHLRNGYEDGQGRTQSAPGEGSRSRSAGRPVYGQGDDDYRFNDLSLAGKPSTNIGQYTWSGSPVLRKDLDYHGLSADIHACRDIFLRVGKNGLSGQSILIDLEGGVVGIVGKDSAGRSLTGSLLGGVEISVGPNNSGQAIGLEVVGNVNWTIRGHWQVDCTGDIVFNSMGNIINHSAKEVLTKGLNVRTASSHQIVLDAPDIVNQQGGRFVTV